MVAKVEMGGDWISTAVLKKGETKPIDHLAVSSVVVDDGIVLNVSLVTLPVSEWGKEWTHQIIVETFPDRTCVTQMGEGNLLKTIKNGKKIELGIPGTDSYFMAEHISEKEKNYA